MTPYRRGLSWHRGVLWEPAKKRAERRAVRGVLLGAAIAVGVGLWIAPAQPSRATKAHDIVHQLAFERYAGWYAAYPMLGCPQRLGQLGGPMLDPWGHAMHYTCDRRLMHQPAGIVVISAGEDGVFGTADDIRSTP